MNRYLRVLVLYPVFFTQIMLASSLANCNESTKPYDPVKLFSDQMNNRETLGDSGFSLVKSIQQSIRDVSNKILPCAVNIIIRKNISKSANKSDLQYSLTNKPKINRLRGIKGNSLGSGFMVHESGYILTSTSVISGAESIAVNIGSYVEKPATVVYEFPELNISILKVELKGNETLQALQWGDSKKILEGSLVITLGNPFGLENSISLGMISSINQTVSGKKYKYFQSDAVINPGNIGGALVDLQGKVVGITTLLQSQGYLGIGFSLPSSIFKAQVIEKIGKLIAIQKGG